MKGRILYIEWLDSCSLPTHWRSEEAAMKFTGPANVCSIGKVLREDAESITLVQNWGGDEVRNDITIIKSCIRKKRLITLDG